jgi:RNA polymerase sigma-70 factor, ECF subfamily
MVMTDDAPDIDAAAEQRYRELIDVVGATLDLDAGMADIGDASRYAALRRDVTHRLDLELGLDGALAVAERAAQPSGSSGSIPWPRSAPREMGLAATGEAAEPPPGPTGTREPADIPEELVTQAMTGDRMAVEDVITTIRPLVVRYCRARLGRFDRSSVSADDVAQEVCLAVLTALPGYRVQGRPFLAFVYGIASHKVIDAHRAATRNRSEPVSDVPDRVEAADGPEQHTLRVELSEEMGRLLDKLPEKQREILVLRVVVGLSAEETAEAVGSTPGAVRVAQHRALARLRKSMPEEEVV